MMESYLHLFEFLCELIDIQIKKYLALSKVGVGPDAAISAELVRQAVHDLLFYANLLLPVFKNAAWEGKEPFQTVFDRIKFYLEQEHLRAHAAWLLDENNFHSSEFKRLNKQKNELNKIGRNAGMDAKSPKASSDIERQLQHDSNAIAYLILNIAILVKQDNNYSFSKDIPLHAQSIIKRHAKPGGRYHDPEIFTDIQLLYRQTEIFLRSSSLKKCEIKLTEEEAEKTAIQQRGEFKALLDEFKSCHIRSRLFNNDHPGYSIFEAKEIPATTEKRYTSLSKAGLFASAMAGSVAIYLLISYLCCTSQPNTCDFRPC